MEKELRLRLFSSIVAVVLFLLVLLLAQLFCFGRFVLVYLTAIIIIIGVYEGVRLLINQTTPNNVRWPAVFLGIFAVTGISWLLISQRLCIPKPVDEALAIIGISSLLALIFWAAVSFYQLRDQQQELIGQFVSGILFTLLVVLGGGCMIVIAQQLPVSYILWLCLVVWANDIAAYFAGKHWGGPKLAPLVSPGKTVSGSVAGLAVAIFIGLLFGSLLDESAAKWQIFTIAILVGISSQVGDLLESFLKRLTNVKDSGMFFPGHGGVLDRLDALLGAAPIFLSIYILLN